MQLTIEVLPAPFGPIIENSSPSFTPKLTSVSARTPPKRSDTPRTSKACSTHSLPGADIGRGNFDRPQKTPAIKGFWRMRRSAPGGFIRARSRAYNGQTVQLAHLILHPKPSISDVS